MKWILIVLVMAGNNVLTIETDEYGSLAQCKAAETIALSFNDIAKNEWSIWSQGCKENERNNT